MTKIMHENIVISSGIAIFSDVFKRCNILLSRYIAIQNAQPWLAPPSLPPQALLQMSIYFPPASLWQSGTVQVQVWGQLCGPILFILLKTCSLIFCEDLHSLSCSLWSKFSTKNIGFPSLLLEVRVHSDDELIVLELPAKLAPLPT